MARKTRDDIIRRTTAGRERARANGVRFGRPPKLSQPDKVAALSRKTAGEPHRLIAATNSVSISTISRLRAKEVE